MRSLVFLSSALWITIAAAEPTADARIHSTLAEHVEPMSLGPDGLAGPGAERLIDEGSDAAFFALGESHLNNETPALTSALLEALRPAGYSVLAIETGPMIAEHAEAEIRAGRAESLAGLFAELPFTAAFIDHQPEFELLERAIALGYAIWGLDQVFAGGARFNLVRLVELAPGDSARAAASEALAKAREGFTRFARTGDTSTGFLQTAEPDDFDRLRRAFAGVPEAIRIIEELAASSRIYQLYSAGENYRSNYERITLMKRHLAEHLRETPGEVKVFMKFGSFHMRRGYTPLNQLDLGNAAAEIGLLRGGGSLHVQVTALESRDGAGERSDWTDDSPHLARFADAMPDGADWAVFDLRPLRPIFHRRANVEGREALAELAWGFDLLVLARRFTRAEPLPGVPPLPGT